MPLFPGLTRVHGIVINGIAASYFRRMQRRLRNYIDKGHFEPAQGVLAEIKLFAGESEVNRQVFEAIRRDASERWLRNWEQFPAVQSE